MTTDVRAALVDCIAALSNLEGSGVWMLSNEDLVAVICLLSECVTFFLHEFAGDRQQCPRPELLNSSLPHASPLLTSCLPLFKAPCGNCKELACISNFTGFLANLERPGRQVACAHARHMTADLCSSGSRLGIRTACVFRQLPPLAKRTIPYGEIAWLCMHGISLVIEDAWQPTVRPGTPPGGAGGLVVHTNCSENR